MLCRRVFDSSLPCFQNPDFFGEAPERRPWAIKREDRPAAFAGRSSSRLSLVWQLGYRPCLPRRVSYPNLARVPNKVPQRSGSDSEKLTGKDREDLGGKDCEALQHRRPLAAALDESRLCR